MAYFVTGPLAVAIVGGKRTVLHKGALVPEGADENRIKHLLAVGLIKEKVAEAAAKPEEKAAGAAPATPARGSRGRAAAKPEEKAAEGEAQAKSDN